MSKDKIPPPPPPPTTHVAKSQSITPSPLASVSPTVKSGKKPPPVPLYSPTVENYVKALKSGDISPPSKLSAGSEQSSNEQTGARKVISDPVMPSGASPILGNRKPPPLPTSRKASPTPPPPPAGRTTTLPAPPTQHPEKSLPIPHFSTTNHDPASGRPLRGPISAMYSYDMDSLNDEVLAPGSLIPQFQLEEFTHQSAVQLQMPPKIGDSTFEAPPEVYKDIKDGFTIKKMHVFMIAPRFDFLRFPENLNSDQHRRDLQFIREFVNRAEKERATLYLLYKKLKVAYNSQSKDTDQDHFYEDPGSEIYKENLKKFHDEFDCLPDNIEEQIKRLDKIMGSKENSINLHLEASTRKVELRCEQLFRIVQELMKKAQPAIDDWIENIFANFEQIISKRTKEQRKTYYQDDALYVFMTTEFAFNGKIKWQRFVEENEPDSYSPTAHFSGEEPLPNLIETYVRNKVQSILNERYSKIGRAHV